MIKINPTTLLQIFYEFTINTKVIFVKYGRSRQRLSMKSLDMPGLNIFNVRAASLILAPVEDNSTDNCICCSVGTIINYN